MIAAKVIDNIWATRKADSLRGLKFMLVEVLGGIDKGRLIIAADTISAGIGERVLVCTGSSARKMLGQDDIPIDAVIVGIIDEDCTF
ncbi:ethanolamine utilization protein EutN [Desulfitobacterium sp. LBE]|uniref:Ethanolamine utilization protein EutN n=6 Tax=root TaxID=1 RepID=Q24MF5_DESHY|nr:MULTISPECIES: EutN/CcmL family microcompartment protein [Desulfitobacterium]ACL22891.1 Ethanolamine utilization protein EutN/carboxysome structural protein Ccml [Desulfitobacterium hafniense DCB-2]EHL05189.1 ethanolamine utilization protein EutN/carboxysome structural protein Ccml [Desulfitobacterium hafniense DP7]KTE93479.1 ethanolamine utilization protein EutN [Desulfitobacterium hafniense]MEA5022820.1 EutN/CcmL family microcompartment protein [Desulfitobacterium hafniense]TWH59077.1 etha